MVIGGKSLTSPFGRRKLLRLYWRRPKRDRPNVRLDTLYLRGQYEHDHVNMLNRFVFDCVEKHVLPPVAKKDCFFVAPYYHLEIFSCSKA